MKWKAQKDSSYELALMFVEGIRLKPCASDFRLGAYSLCQCVGV